MNIYDISAKAGVSIATVSRVINGSSSVKASTRAKVLAVVEEYGYTPNVFARGLGTNSMQTIGLLCADVSDPYLAKGIYYLEGMLRQQGYDVLLCCTGYEKNTKEKYLSLLLNKRVDGIILIGSNYVEAKDQENDYIRSAAKEIPVIIVNAALSGSNIYNVLCDDYQSVFDVTTTCLQAGRQKLLFLFNNVSYSSRQKTAGFKAAFEAMSLPLLPDCIQQIRTQDNSIQKVIAGLMDLTNNNLHFEGIITADDILAVGAVKYAKKIGRKIPQDLLIIGYNNSSITEYCEPELSSIDNQLEAICTQSVGLLLEVLRGKTAPSTTYFSGQLVERHTTAF